MTLLLYFCQQPLFYENLLEAKKFNMVKLRQVHSGIILLSTKIYFPRIIYSLILSGFPYHIFVWLRWIQVGKSIDGLDFHRGPICLCWWSSIKFWHWRSCQDILWEIRLELCGTYSFWLLLFSVELNSPLVIVFMIFTNSLIF